MPVPTSQPSPNPTPNCGNGEFLASFLCHGCLQQTGCAVHNPDVPCVGIAENMLSCSTLEAGYHAAPGGVVSPVDCPQHSTGDDVVSGCLADAGYHGDVSTTTTSPFYAIDEVNGAAVAPCTSQTGCAADTPLTCTTGADVTRLKCTTLEAGFAAKSSTGVVSTVACPANTDPLGTLAWCLTLTMSDTHGDGWNGAGWMMVEPSSGLVEASGDLADGASSTVQLCGSGYYTFTVGSGAYPEEISWTIVNPDDGATEASGVAGASVTIGRDPCSPKAYYHGHVSATTTSPFYATNGVNGAGVALCTLQVPGCIEATVPSTCAVGTDSTVLECAVAADGYRLDPDNPGWVIPDCPSQGAACTVDGDTCTTGASGGAVLRQCDVPAAGYHVDSNGVATQCGSQGENVCAQEGSTCITEGASETLLKCEVAAAGYFVDPDGAAQFLPPLGSDQVHHVVIERTVNIQGLTASEFNTQENIDKFVAVIEAALPGEEQVTDVVATDVARRLRLRHRRALLAPSLDVSFKIATAVGSYDAADTSDATFNKLASALKTTVTSGSLLEALQDKLPEVSGLDDTKFKDPPGFNVAIEDAVVANVPDPGSGGVGGTNPIADTGGVGIVGTLVPIVLAFVVIVAAALWYWRRRRKSDSGYEEFKSR